MGARIRVGLVDCCRQERPRHRAGLNPQESQARELCGLLVIESYVQALHIGNGTRFVTFRARSVLLVSAANASLSRPRSERPREGRGHRAPRVVRRAGGGPASPSRSKPRRSMRTAAPASHGAGRVMSTSVASARLEERVPEARRRSGGSPGGPSPHSCDRRPWCARSTMRPPAAARRRSPTGPPLIVCERGYQVAQRCVQTSKARAGGDADLELDDQRTQRSSVFSATMRKRVAACPRPRRSTADRLDALGAQRVDVARPLGLVADQAGLLEQAQVPRDRGPADRQLVGDLLHRPRALPEDLEDRAAVGVAAARRGRRGAVPHSGR